MRVQQINSLIEEWSRAGVVNITARLMEEYDIDEPEAKALYLNWFDKTYGKQ